MLVRIILCDGFDIGVETSFHISVNKIAIADFVEKMSPALWAGDIFSTKSTTHTIFKHNLGHCGRDIFLKKYCMSQ